MSLPILFACSFISLSLIFFSVNVSLARNTGYIERKRQMPRIWAIRFVSSRSEMFGTGMTDKANMPVSGRMYPSA